LTALPTRITRFFGRPLVRRAFFMSGAPAFAGDLALLFGRHRSKTASFFAHSFHSHPPRYSETGCDRLSAARYDAKSCAGGLQGGCHHCRKTAVNKPLEVRHLRAFEQKASWPD
jgi:hypothetical protein